MKPLYHPSVADITVEGILYALSDSVRAQIFCDIASSTCPQSCSSFRDISSQPLPKSTLSQHFKVLRETGLIRSERKGVELHNAPRCEELSERFGPLISAIIDAYKQENTKKH